MPTHLQTPSGCPLHPAQGPEVSHTDCCNPSHATSTTSSSASTKGLSPPLPVGPLRPHVHRQLIYTPIQLSMPELKALHLLLPQPAVPGGQKGLRLWYPLPGHPGTYSHLESFQLHASSKSPISSQQRCASRSFSAKYRCVLYSYHTCRISMPIFPLTGYAGPPSPMGSVLSLLTAAQLSGGGVPSHTHAL